MTVNVVSVVVEEVADVVETEEAVVEMIEVEIVVVAVVSGTTISVPITIIKKALDLIIIIKEDLAHTKPKLLILMKVDFLLDLMVKIVEEVEVDTEVVVDEEVEDVDEVASVNLTEEVEVTKGKYLRVKSCL